MTIYRDNSEQKKVVILFIVVILFSITFSVILSMQEVVLIRSDHFSRWYATHKLVTENRSIYDSRNGEEIVSLNTIPVDPIEGSFFYPAHLLIFLLPLAKLPYPVAHFIWLTLIQIFLLLGIWLVYRETHWPPSVNQLALLVMLSILFIPNLQNTTWGQFNTISVLSLALVFVALRKKRYFVAGVFAIGFTFKPQTMLLTLIFFLIWAAFQRKRWSFVLGFGATSLGLWLFSEYLEPNWIINFLQGVQSYSGYLNPQSVITYPLKQSLLLFGLVSVLNIWLFLRNVCSPSDSVNFAGCIMK